MSPSLSNLLDGLNRWGAMHAEFAGAMFVQSALLLVVLAVLDVLLLRRLRATVRYAVWSLLLVKLMLPVTLATPLSIGQWLSLGDEAPPVAATARDAANELPMSPGWESDVADSIPFVSGPVPTDDALPQMDGEGSAEPAIALTEAVAGNHSPASTVRLDPAVRPLRWLAVVMLLWCAGVLGLVVVALRHAARVRRIVRRSAVPSPELAELFCESTRRTGVSPRRVQLRITEELHSPAICGFWTGTVLLPRALPDELDHGQLRFVLVHELTHWRRRDLQVNLLQTCLQVVYFYNPVVWIANFVLRRLREQAVDEAVLVVLDAPPQPYSEILLKIAAAVRSPVELSVRMIGVVESGRALSGRIRRMLSRPVPRRARLGMGGFIAVLMTGVLLLPMAYSQPVDADSVANETPATRNADRAVYAQQQPDAAPKPAAAADADAIVQELVNRSRLWIRMPPERIKSLQYTFELGNDTRQVELLSEGWSGWTGMWFGATLATGTHYLLKFPDRCDVKTERIAAAADEPERLRLTVTTRPGQQRMSLAVGNGVVNSWRGYFSHGSDVMTLEVDPVRMVPLRELHRVGDDPQISEIRYGEYVEVEPGQWVPRLVEVLHGDVMPWRMHFAWQQDQVWMLTQGEIDQDGKPTVVARVSNIRVNDGEFLAQGAAEKQRRAEALAVLTGMLERNQPWLSADYAPLESLEYSFHAVREDVKERCAVGADGTSVFEVVHDGQGKMKEGADARKIALPTGEWGSTKRDDPLVYLDDPEKEDREPSYSAQLREYGRIGCQFDLPLFDYAKLLKDASIEVQDGEWNGTPCHVATVSGFRRKAYLGFGTMMAFTSWSYMHHLQPALETIYIDKTRLVPVHETFISHRDDRIEIDFGEYREVAPQKWAPLSIRIDDPGHFTCEYTFQIVADSHWLLSQVESWFDAADKSRGVVGDIAVNRPSPLLESALKQVEATRRLFAPVDESAGMQVELPAHEFSLGRRLSFGDVEAVFTLDKGELVFNCRAAGGEGHPGRIAAALLDAKQQLLGAGSAELVAGDGGSSARIPFGRSSALAKCMNIVLWIDGEPVREGARPVAVRAYALGESPLAVNVPDQETGETRLTSLALERSEAGEGIARIGLASRDGPAEFGVDACLCVLAADGRLVSAGMLQDKLRVAGQVAQKTVDVRLSDDVEASGENHAIVGVTRGQTYSAPMGSTWGHFMSFSSPIFPVEQLLLAEDYGCWRPALDELSEQFDRDARFLRAYFQDPDRREDDKDRQRRLEKLRPHAARLVHVATQAQDPRLIVQATRYVGLAGDREQADAIAPLLSSDSPTIQDAAAVALGMLGRADGIERLPALLTMSDAELLLRQSASGFPANKPVVPAFNWEDTALLALTEIATERAVEIIGAQAWADLQSFVPENAAPDQPSAEVRARRLYRLWRALGAMQRDDAAAELRRAAEFLRDDPQLAFEFNPTPLVIALLDYEDSMSDLLNAMVLRGDARGAAVLDQARRPNYVAAVREVVFAPGSSSDFVHESVGYLWTAGTPEAVALLGEMYDRRVPADRRSRTLEARALAAHGDERGLAEAFELIVRANAPETPPAGDKFKREWERNRRDLHDDGIAVFRDAASATSVKYVVQHAGTTDVATQLACLAIAGYLPDLPPDVLAVLETWKRAPDQAVALKAAQLLQRGR